MSVTIDLRRSEREICIVDITGKIDIYSAQQFKSALLGLLEDGHQSLLLNFEHVEYIDSTGLGVLIGALKRMRKNGGRLDIICANPFTRKLFEITGLARAFAIFRDEPAALRTLAQTV